jgi:fatty acid elongase 3
MKLADLILQTFPSLPSLVPLHLKQWTPGSTPLSTTPIVLTVMLGYLTTIFSIRAYMNNNGGKGGRDPFVMNGLFRAHNLLLSVGSGVLLVLMAEEIGPVVLQRGLRGAICDEEAWTPVSLLAFSLFHRLCIEAKRFTAEDGVLLHRQLLYQVLRAY